MKEETPARGYSIILSGKIEAQDILQQEALTTTGVNILKHVNLSIYTIKSLLLSTKPENILQKLKKPLKITKSKMIYFLGSLSKI